MTTATMTLLDALVLAVRKAGHINRGVLATPAAILWPDAERQWESVLPRLLAVLPELLVLGPYRPDKRQGPAIWLKWALAGRAEGYTPGKHIPIIYLPGVGRSDLRAIETCERDLQPLAELQYRGTFFSQQNAKDWTVNAFLVSKQGGQSLTVAKDLATQEALARAVAAAGLLDRPIDELQGRTLDAPFFNAMLAPRPERDALEWLIDPVLFKQQKTAAHWDVFRSRCQKDLAFDPEKMAVEEARERFCQAQGGWKALWSWYEENHLKVPGLYEKLLTVQPPQAQGGLFASWEACANYPSFNAAREDELRTALVGLAQKSPAEARSATEQLENLHGPRRKWLWAQMGEAPLAQVLESLAAIARGGAQAVAGQTPETMADAYRQAGWKVDAASLKAQAGAGSLPNRQAVEAALKAIYVPWLDDTARRFQKVVHDAGGLGPRSSHFEPAESGTCTVFVDGLRYDVAMMLQERLNGLGETAVHAAWTSLPSVTASGKAWVSPIAAAVEGRPDDADFEPGVAGTPHDLNAYYFKKLLQEGGIQRLGGDATADVNGRAWTEVGDLDQYGHEHGLKLARDLDKRLDELVESLEELIGMGWRRVRIVTDHGWLLVPGAMPKVELASHQAATRWGRCATLNASAPATDHTFNWSWCPDVRIAVAPGIGSFKAGEVYSHGGLSLQESLVPILELRVPQAAAAPVAIDLELAWVGLTCTVTSAPLAEFKVDIRTKPHDAASSVVASPKGLESGKARLLVDDDDKEGVAASVVVLNAQGSVVHKMTTVIGE